MENKYPENISHEEVAALPPVRFEGKIVVVDDPAAIERACEDLMACRCIGFDTETRPSFKPGIMNKVALLQLSTPNTCYLFRLNKIPLERPIIRILESKQVMKVGADIANDIKALQKLRHFRAGNFVDLQSIVNEWGIAEKSVRKMAGIVVGRRVSKAQRLSNWEAGTFTDAQKMYAATDAWVCLRIHSMLNETDRNPLPLVVKPPAEPKEKTRRTGLNRRTRNNKKRKKDDGSQDIPEKE